MRRDRITSKDERTSLSLFSLAEAAAHLEITVDDILRFVKHDWIHAEYPRGKNHPPMFRVADLDKFAKTPSGTPSA